MPDKLTKFLIELSEDPAKRREFDADPQAMMNAAGLSATDQELLLSRNPSRIRARYGMTTIAHMTRIPGRLISILTNDAAKLEDIADDLRKIADELSKTSSAAPPKKKKASKKKKKK